MTTTSWSDLLGSRDKRQEYTEAILELASVKEEALSTWIYINELVAFLRRDDNPQEWPQTRDYLDTVYLRTTTPESHTPPLRLPRTVLDSLEPILPLSSSSSSTEYPTIRLTLIESIRAGLVYLEKNVSSSISPNSSTPLREEIVFLLEKERNVDFPTPPSSATRESIMMTAREPSHEGSTQSIASLLLNHYAFPSRNSTTTSSRPTSATAEEELSEDEDNVDTRSIHTGIKEARESIVRKEDKLRWLLGDNFHKGPQPRSSATNSSTPTTSSSTTSSSSSHNTVRGRPVSTTPTASRVFYQDESSSTIGALPEFPPTSSSSTFEPRGSVDSYAASTIDPRGSLSTHRHSRLISTSSSTSPLLASARPSTVSTREQPSLPTPALSPHRRVLSTGVLSDQPPYSFDQSNSSSNPLDSNLVDRPNPSPTSSSSRPFSHLYHLDSHHQNHSSTSRTSKRHSLDSAKDQLSHSTTKRDTPLARGGGTPFDCQELSERDKSELVWRNKKLEKLLGSRVHQQGSMASGFGSVKVQRRRAVSDEVELMNGGAGVSGGERERERELRRPVSIMVPGLNLGGVSRVSGRAEEEKAPVSPTTIAPVENIQQSPSNDSSNPNRPSMMMHRSSSTPTSPLSPTTPLDQGLPCSSSSSSFNQSISNSTSTTKTTRPIMNHHSNSYTSTSSTSSATSTTTTAEEQEKREERRKKLEKVRRVLGERVPLGLVVELKPQLYDYEQHEQTGSGTGMGKSKSRQMGERLKDVFHRPESPVTVGGGKGKKGRGNEQDRENWVGTQSAPQFGGGVGGYDKKNVRASGDRGVQGVEALTKARKLESLFGDLPPQSLYLAPTSSTQGNHPPTRSPLLLHRRSHSDLGVTRSGSVSTTSSSMNGSARGSFDSDLCRTRSNSSSVQSYRRSIASLRYVMEQDPTALDEVVRAYAGGGATHPRDASDEGLQRHSLSTSTTSHAAVRKAQKLSSFFGTTKGEVWERLLDDIASAVHEDEELEDDERQEVLESLDKLREGTQTYSHQPTQQFHQHRQQQIQQLEQLQI